MEDWVDKGIVEDVATYEEYKRFRYHKRVFGAHFMIGGREYLSRNRKWLVEAYGGLGIQFKREGMPYEADSRYSPPNSLRSLDEGSGFRNRVVPAVQLGIRLVYNIFLRSITVYLLYFFAQYFQWRSVQYTAAVEQPYDHS